ncbi:methyltransferase domain-containing protein [Lysobacter terrae]
MSPVLASRQSIRHPGDGPLGWFASAAGQGLLTVEAAAMARVLAGIPALPWCWIGLPGTAPPEVSGGRGVLMRREVGEAGLRFGGALRCALPLPLANESFGAVLLQHALDDDVDADALLGECERILVPGGTLWLAALNAWSPYRARWARTGLRAHVTGKWQASLRRAGFALDSVHLQWLGPRWRMDQGDIGVGMNDWLRAGIALSVNKRVHALLPPARVPSFRLQGAAHSRQHPTCVSWRFESLRSEQLKRQAIMGK